MNKLLLVTLLLSALVLSGCARNAQIIVDPKGIDMAKYQSDLAECQQLSQQVESKTGKGIIGGAAVGAVAGEIIGGGKRTRVLSGLGALRGGVHGGAATRHERQRVVKNCLRLRGYRVLN